MDYSLFVDVNETVDYPIEERLDFRGEESTQSYKKIYTFYLSSKQWLSSTTFVWCKVLCNFI